MKISPLLAALGGGAMGLGLSQGGLGGAGMALSPMLALLLKGKHGRDKDHGPKQDPLSPPAQGAPVPGNPGIVPPQAPGNTGIVPPPAPQAPPAAAQGQPQGQPRDPRIAAMLQALLAQQNPAFNAQLAQHGYQRY